MSAKDAPNEPDLVPSISLVAYRELDEAGQKLLDATFAEYELDRHPVMELAKEARKHPDGELKLFNKARTYFDTPAEMIEFIMNAMEVVRQTEQAKSDYNRLRFMVKKMGMG